MATHARQQYFADEHSLSKENREFSIADDIQQKIDGIEPGAQVNKIETVKVNGTALVPDANRAVNVEVPEVIDNLYTVDPDNALSAKQGKLLYDYIQNIASRGRFLSNWNSATGLPMTNPSESPYPYKSGDYFNVSNVAGSGGTNYRPDGSSYVIGQASTVVETEDVSVSDFYFYDGTDWLLLSNSGRQIAIDTSLSTTSTNPVENRVITNALNLKANDADISTVGKSNDYNDLDNLPSIPDSLDDLSGDSDDIVEGSVHLFLTLSERTNLSHQSGINTGDENQGSIKQKLGAASSSSDGYLTSTNWNTFNNKQNAIQDLSDIRNNATAGKNASDAIATYGNIVTHDVNEFATATQGAKADTALQNGDNVSELINDAGYITNAYHDNTKQDKLIAGNNIQIAADGKTISATDTTYTAGTGINIDSNNVISATATPGQTYTAGDGINIDANNEISNTLPGPTIAATAPTGTEGALWYDTANNMLMAYNGTAWKEAGTQMKVLSYGNSTWQDFLNAYKENAVVYCRASSQSNPATGTQGRLAFMAYVNNADNPTEVEFQYYRSRSSHSTAANVLDEVYVYKLVPTSGGTWTVTQRDTAAKPIAGTGIGLTYNASGMTISADTTVLATKTDLNSKQDTISDLATIRSGAGLGATSVQPGDDISDLNNDAGYITSSYHDSTKQNVISDLATIRSGASAGATAVQPADVLTKTNTTSYTPTGDYNPSTKKYVDDIVGDIDSLLSNI